MLLGMLLVNSPAFAHGHHAHGAPMTEVEQKAAAGVFDDANVRDRALTDWDGMWQSVYPYLVSGELDPVFRQKAKKDPEKTFEDIKAYYRKGYATNVETIGIENGVIEFHRDNNVASCKYNYAGYKILTYASGKKGCATCSNVKMRIAKRLNMFSLAIISLPRANRRTSISLWEIPRSRHCCKRWKTGLPIILIS